MFRTHPWILSALGVAIVVSVPTVAFGIGVLLAGWFGTETSATQLAILSGRVQRRTRSWIRATAITVGIVGTVIAATWLGIVMIGPDFATVDRANLPLPWPEATARVSAIATGTLVTTGFIAPFVYAPLILIERGGTVGAAVVESAWLVRRGGVFRHWTLVFAAHVLSILPALGAAVVVARTLERAATPFGLLLALPVLPISIPLGLGLVTAAYVARRDALHEPRWTRRESLPERRLVGALSFVVGAPLIALALMLACTVRTAPPGAPTIPERGVFVMERVGPFDDPTVLWIPDTTVAIRIAGHTVAIEGGDGLRTVVPGPRVPLDRVRIHRRGDVYRIRYDRGPASAQIAVDRAAVRIDDTLRARLRRRAPMGWWLALALAFALCGFWLVRALAAIGQVRRLYGVPSDHRAPRAHLDAVRRASFRRAWRIALALWVPAGVALVGGLLAHAA